MTLAYCALHVVEMLAASEGVHNPDHAARDAYLQRSQPKLRGPYKAIKDAGYFARYRPDDLRLTAANIETGLRKKHLNTLMQEAEKVLGGNSEP